MHAIKEEQTTMRETSPIGNDERPKERKEHVEQLGPRSTIEYVTVTSCPRSTIEYVTITPCPRTLEPIIADIITIYDDDSEYLDSTTCPTIND
jgi:hypothetical protein